MLCEHGVPDFKEPAVSIRLVAVHSTAAADLALWAHLAAEPSLELSVLFSHRDESGRGQPSEASFHHEFLPARRIGRNVDRGTSVVWNVGLEERLGDLSPDLLLVGGYGNLTALRAAIWAQKRNVPWFMFSETWIRGSRYWLKRLILPPLLARASGFVVLGQPQARYIRDLGGVAPFVVIGSNRDLLSLSKRTDEVRAAFANSRQRKKFLFLGRLVEGKGLNNLLSSFRGIQSRLSQWDLIVVGDGPMAEEVHGLSGRGVRVEHISAVPFDRIPNILAQADVLVLPSRFEPWGQVVPEAMAAGLPVIASDRVGSASHFIEEAVTGWTFPVDDSIALAKVLEAASLADLRTMSGNAKSKALQWDVRQAAARITELASIIIQHS